MRLHGEPINMTGKWALLKSHGCCPLPMPVADGPYYDLSKRVPALMRGRVERFSVDRGAAPDPATAQVPWCVSRKDGEFEWVSAGLHQTTGLWNGSERISLQRSLNRSLNGSDHRSSQRTLNMYLIKSLNGSDRRSLQRSLNRSLNRSFNGSDRRSLQRSSNKPLNG